MPSKKRRSRPADPADRGSVAGGGDARRDLLAAFLLAGIVAFVFRRGLANGLVADDFSLINYCRPEGLGSILGFFDPWREVWYYRPVTRLVFALGYTLFGTHAAPYHAVSLLAHAAAVVLLYFVARRAGASVAPSFLGAVVFAVHFRQHESVFWFSAISYPLSTSFGLLSALFFRASVAKSSSRLLVAALAASAAAMLTKDTAIVVPVLAGLYGLLFAGDSFAGGPFAGGPFARGASRRNLLRLLPLALVALVGVGLQAVPVEGRPFARGGAGFSPKAPAESLAFFEKSAALLVPGLDAPGDIAPGAAALIAIVLFVAYVLIRRTPLALFGLAWVVLAQLPFYAFVPRMGDLYVYLPLAGVALVFVDAAELLGSGASRRVPRALGAVGLAAFVVWSHAWIQAKAFRWRAAGEIVEGVVAEVKVSVKAERPGLARGGTLVLEGLPATIGGVYAFLNAVPAAFWLAFDDRTLNVVQPRPGDARVESGTPRFLYERGRFYEVDAFGGRRLLREFADAD